ncbi:MAG: hypothetical protein IKR11_04910, partial [Solobacterium sp.]|nr:hypothetical protein [Solobacterium sp.]
SYLDTMESFIHYENTDVQNLKDAITSYGCQQVLPLMEEMPVEEIARIKSNLKISVLKNAGYSSLADIMRATPEDISSVNGISKETALFLFDACKKIQLDLASVMHFRLRPEQEQEGILHALYKMIMHPSLAQEAQELSDLYKDRLLSLLEEIQPLKRNGFLSFFTPFWIKNKANSAFEHLKAIHDGMPGTRMEELLKKDREIENISFDSLVKHYRTNVAQYENLIEKIDDRFVDYDILEGGIPAEMAQEINRYHLDLDLMKSTLRRYQTFGVKYILAQKNVLLGDEMGLGKTVEAIGAMAHLAENGAMHFMVVCPAGVLLNWQREIQYHSHLHPVLLHGKDLNALEEWIHFGGVALTSYQSMHNYTLPKDFYMELLVADEAQYVKNPQAKRTIKLRELSLQANRTLYMSGTPLENRVDEMCELVNALQPVIASQLEGRKYMAAAPQFKELLAPVYLRRKRVAVLDELPGIIYMDEWCELTPLERTNYLIHVESGSFNQMRRVSWDTPSSTKAERLLELVENAEEEGRKVLIFSFFLDTMEKISQILKDRCIGMISGSVPLQKRQEIIDTFGNAKPGSVLVMQSVSGGTGINLQMASMIIFAEPQIKPSIEHQAVSRAYRMGQTQSVSVHRLLAADTIDEAMCEMLQKKQEIFDAFADDSVIAEAENETLSQNEWIHNLIQKEKEKNHFPIVPVN